tara:strand:- start:108 stop:554 length:447 start_codon:yes stop_codon:yes gene_type:complete
MRLIIQRVTRASLTVNNKIISKINNGLVVFIGITHSDTVLNIPAIANKTINLRLFNDENNKMNLSLLDISGDLLIVSQFTLHANFKKGNRPSFLNSASSEHAKKIYNEFVNYMNNKLNKVQTGIFGAHMAIELINDGPVTFILDSNEK